MNKKIITLGLAGTLLIGSVSFAEKLQELPENKQIEISESLKQEKNIEIKEKIVPTDKLHDLKIRLPEIKGLEDKNFQEELNYLIDRELENSLREFNEAVKSTGEKNPLEAGSFIMDYEVKSMGDIISIEINKYSIVKGQANGQTEIDYYNIDILNNRVLKLEDVFKKDSNYKDLLNMEISKEIESNPEVYFQDKDNKFKSVDEDSKFYFNKDGNLVIAFDKYEIAPGSSGNPEFEIERIKIKDLLLDLNKLEKPLVVSRIFPIAKNENIKVRIPLIDGLDDKELEDNINKDIKKRVNESIASFREKSKAMDLASDMKSELEIDYEIKSEGDILSFGISEFKIFAGDANPSLDIDYYNIDTLNNRLITLKDLFKDGSDYKKFINDQIRLNIEKNKDDFFKLGEEGGFTTINDSHSYYINKDNNIVLVFDKYEIAPGSSGRPEFIINNELIKNIRKELNKEEKKEIEVFNRVIINGKPVDLKDSIIRNKNGNIMLPMVELGVNMEYEPFWDGENMIAGLDKGNIQARADLKENQYSFARAMIKLDHGAELIEGRTFVPADFFNQVLKLETSIDNKGVFNINY